MRKSGVAEKYFRALQGMYVSSKTVVMCAVGVVTSSRIGSEPLLVCYGDGQTDR